MENQNEKFFEQLAYGEEPEERESAEIKVELAKATSSPISRPKVKIETDEADEEDHNEPEGQLTLDVYQAGNDILVESAVAGVEPEDLDINVTTDSITIRGRRRRRKEIKEEDYFYQECYWGRFSRSVILPQEVDPEKTSATFKNGILTVRMSKLSRNKTKKVRVKFE